MKAFDLGEAGPYQASWQSPPDPEAIEQAEQLFISLKMLGQKVSFARFPNETHELSRSGSPNRKMERLRLLINWFKNNL